MAYHQFTQPAITGNPYTIPTYRGWQITATLIGWDAFHPDYDETMWAPSRVQLMREIDAYEAELDAAMVDARAYLAALPPERRAQLEREWVA